ncbi:MAG: hypothetical protein OEQ53_03135 [Saprospiraceae bacterium]|nr:hypothetical protein [Saprospiraceae bacterium]
MLKVLARNIVNLTDARYFAAHFADVLSVPWNGTLDDMAFMNGVKAWVEGVTWALELPREHAATVAHEIDSEMVSHCLLFDRPSSVLPSDIGQWIILDDDISLEDLYSDAHIEEVVALIVSMSWLQSLAQSQDLTIPLWITIDEPEQLHKLEKVTIPIEGIVLSGSPEELVGLKTYENLDAILEMCSELR